MTERTKLAAEAARRGGIALQSRLNFALFAAGMLVVAARAFLMISATSP